MRAYLLKRLLPLPNNSRLFDGLAYAPERQILCHVRKLGA